VPLYRRWASGRAVRTAARCCEACTPLNRVAWTAVGRTVGQTLAARYLCYEIVTKRREIRCAVASRETPIGDRTRHLGAGPSSRATWRASRVRARERGRGRERA